MEKAHKEGCRLTNEIVQALERLDGDFDVRQLFNEEFIHELLEINDEAKRSRLIALTEYKAREEGMLNAWKDFVDLTIKAEETDKHKKEVQAAVASKFSFYTLPSLTDAERMPPEFIVDGMIPVGLSFLAGAPKIRKSFLALQLAAAVAGGRDFLGRHTVKCDVVYLDLEGSKSRISTRAGAMGIPLPDNLFIANSTPSKLAGTLTADLRELHRQRPAIRLVIIDTYSRARGIAKSYGANAYDADVGLLEPIQRMATDENIAVLFVHHERKGAAFAADSFERLSGTMGISGSADAVLNLVADGKRADGRATLEYNPRDAIGGELNLIFDNVTCKWVPSDFQNGQMLDEPVIRWIIQNAPDKAQTRFSDYHSAYYEVYHHQSERPADAIRNAVEKYQQQLFAAHGIAVQVGAKSNDKRGIRIVKV